MLSGDALFFLQHLQSSLSALLNIEHSRDRNIKKLTSYSPVNKYALIRFTREINSCTRGIDREEGAGRTKLLECECEHESGEGGIENVSVSCLLHLHLSLSLQECCESVRQYVREDMNKIQMTRGRLRVRKESKTGGEGRERKIK